ncbi:hypothetical protein KCP76_05130 [Salmonella enterica subsp. enterica serovar Weltevreden]|nr:hypothetical protein KCP76_05130 [Salmonella enterica subsp. enterica serovar Weltevreden]
MHYLPRKPEQSNCRPDKAKPPSGIFTNTMPDGGAKCLSGLQTGFQQPNLCPLKVSASRAGGNNSIAIKTDIAPNNQRHPTICKHMDQTVVTPIVVSRST